MIIIYGSYCEEIFSRPDSLQCQPSVIQLWTALFNPKMVWMATLTAVFTHREASCRQLRIHTRTSLAPIDSHHLQQLLAIF